MGKICTCGAEIEFLKMESGEAMPYRPDTGKLRLVRYVRGGESFGKLVTTFLPHFADCPDAKDFKREK